MFWQVFLVILLVWLLVVRWKNTDKREMTRKIKNDMLVLPVLGITHHVAGSCETVMNGIIKVGNEAIKHGGLTSLWLLNQAYVAVADPVDLEVLSKKCLQKDDVLKFLQVLTGNGLVFAPVPIWKHRRKIMAPTFSQKNLNHFFSTIAKQSAILVDRLDEVANNETFSIWKYMTSFTLDSVCESTLGVNLGMQKESNLLFLKSFEGFSHDNAQRIMRPWFHSDFLYWFTPHYTRTRKNVKYMKNFVSNIIADKKKASEERVHQNAVDEDNNDTGKPVTKSFLELLIDSPEKENGFTDLELQEEVLVLLLAGTDTSSVGASFTLLMLSKHLDVQEKVYEEILDVFGDDDRPITAEDLPRLKYLDAVIKETLRLYPPVPVVVRRTDKEVILPSGAKIVSDVGLIFHIWAMHRNPRYWGDDANVYRPERFFDTVLEHPAAFMPFSFGPRNCIGYQYGMMSMKTVVTSLVRRFKILPAEHIVQDSDKPLRLEFCIMMKHVDNFQLKLAKRK